MSASSARKAPATPLHVKKSSVFLSRRSLTIALLLLVAMAYLPGLSGQFVVDDYHLLQGRGELIRSHTGFKDLVTHPFWWGAPAAGDKSDLYRPWVSATYWLEYRLSGGSPALSHVSNWLLHLANAGLILLLFTSIIGVEYALVVAALSALSPIAISSVGWISGRTDLWAACFMLLFLILFRAARQSGSLLSRLGAVAALFLALASKEIAVIAPVVAALLDYVSPVVHDAPKKNAPPKSSALLDYGLLLVPLFLYFVIRSKVVGAAISGGFGKDHILQSIPYFPEQFFRTTAHILLPLHYDFWSTQLQWSDPATRGIAFIAAWLVFVALMVLLLVGLKRRQLWAAAGAWYVGTLFPVYVFGGSFAPVVDLYAYSGLAAFWLCVVDALRSVLSLSVPAQIIRRKRFFVASAAVALLFAALVAIRLPILHSERSLWTHQLERDPHSSIALMALAEIAFREGDSQQGLQRTQQAIDADLKAWVPHLTLVQYYLEQGDLQQAAPHVDALAKLAPRQMKAQAMIGRFYYEAGHCPDAVHAYEQAAALQTLTPEALFDYGLALLCAHEDRRAGEIYEEALRARPGWPQASNNLGICYENLGNLDQAAVCYQNAVTNDPNLASAWESLALVSIKQRKFDDARRAATRYFALNPPQDRADKLRASLAAVGTAQP
ncbi:MAG TPA: tetratricopeptide repeat protein [bacterium]|jgi:Tfp pilus assembly protein PilF